MDHSLSGSAFCGIFQARIPEWVAISSSRGSSWPRDGTGVSCISCTASRFFTTEPLGKPKAKQKNLSLNTTLEVFLLYHTCEIKFCQGCIKPVILDFRRLWTSRRTINENRENCIFTNKKYVYNCCSVTKLCLTLCSIPSFLVLPISWSLLKLMSLCQWCHPTISSPVNPFSSCPQSFPASRSFPMSWLFPSGGQSIRASVPI